MKSRSRLQTARALTRAGIGKYCTTLSSRSSGSLLHTGDSRVPSSSTAAAAAAAVDAPIFFFSFALFLSLSSAAADGYTKEEALVNPPAIPSPQPPTNLLAKQA
jgi:hypothetical protein